MNPQEVVAMIMTVAISGAIGFTWVTLHYKSKAGVTPKELARIEDRLARIEQAVDAIALEAERIAEGQRFATKLLSEKTGTGSGR